MAIAANGPEDRVEQLVMLTERLTEMMAEQARAFEERRPQDAGANMEEMARLANLYRHESARVRESPAMVAGASPAVRAQLLRATEAFDAVLARHGRAVNAARTVTEGLVRAIADEVANQRAKGVTYGPGATATNGATATAITLNRTA